MSMKMHDEPDGENRIVKTARRVYGVEARRKIDRELHTAICSVPTSERHRDWHFDLRRKRLQAWGGTLRVIDTLIEGGASAEVCLRVAETLKHYTEEQLAERDGDGRGRAA